MKIKCLYPTVAIAAMISASLSITTTYSQNRWFTQHAVITKLATKSTNETNTTMPTNDPYRQTETLSVMRYGHNANSDTQTIQTSTQSFDSHGASINGSAVYRSRLVSDRFTGKPVIKYHGDYNGTSYSTVDYLSYNAFGQAIHDENHEVGIDGKPVPVMTKSVQYTLSANGYSVKTTIGNAADGSHSHTVHSDALGRKTCETDSTHGNNKICLARYAYDDLNHVSTITDDLHGNVEAKIYDAQGELLTDSNREYWSKSIAHTISKVYQYDHVLNQVKTRKQGRLTGQPMESTGWQTQQLSDNGKVTQETDAADNNPQVNSTLTNSFTRKIVLDNFNEKISDSNGNSRTPEQNLLNASYRYDAQGNLQTSTIQARADHQQGNDQDQAIQVNFAYGLNAQLVSKSVNDMTNYWHDYDSNKQRIAEYRRLDKQGHWLHKIYQHPNSDPYQVNISHWLTAGETTTEQNTQETDRFIDVDGKPQLAEKTIWHNGAVAYKIQYTYNRLVNKVDDIIKRNKDGDILSEIKKTYNLDGTLSQQQSQLSSRNHAITSPAIIQYSYYPDTATDKNQRGRLQQKTDAANVTTTYTYHGGQIFTAVASLNDKPIASVKNDTLALNELHQKTHWRGDVNSQLIDTNTYIYTKDFKRLTHIGYKVQNAKTGTNWIGQITYNYHQNPDDPNSPLTQHVTRKIEYTGNNNDAWYRTDYGYNNRNEVSSVVSTKYNAALGEQNSATLVHHFDALGNTIAITPTAQSKVGKTALSLGGGDSYTFSYGDLGELTQIDKNADTPQVLQYDNNAPDKHEGNLTKDEAGNSYTYDADNRQASISVYNKDSHVTTMTHYTYGADDIRDSKHDANTQLDYVYEGIHLVNTFEIKGKDQGSKVSYFGNDDARIVQFSNGTTQVNFLTHDNRHSVINSISGDGSQVKTYHYNINGAYTDGTANQTTTLDIRHSAPQFAANHDQETQYNDYKIARYVRVFDGVLARFTTMDYGDKGLQLMSDYQLDGQNLLENQDMGGHRHKSSPLLLTAFLGMPTGMLALLSSSLSNLRGFIGLTTLSAMEGLVPVLVGDIINKAPKKTCLKDGFIGALIGGGIGSISAGFSWMANSESEAEKISRLRGDFFHEQRINVNDTREQIQKNLRNQEKASIESNIESVREPSKNWSTLNQNARKELAGRHLQIIISIKKFKSRTEIMNDYFESMRKGLLSSLREGGDVSSYEEMFGQALQRVYVREAD